MPSPDGTSHATSSSARAPQVSQMVQSLASQYHSVRPPPEFVTLNVTDHTSITGSVDCADSALVGLHACGGLTPLVLRAFTESSASALVCVGCCYRQLVPNPGGQTTSQDEGDEAHHPLSACVRRTCPPALLMSLCAPAVLELGTHACEQWCRGCDTKLRSHGNRAILETLLQELDDSAGEAQRAVSRLRLKKGARASEAVDAEGFLAYARAVLQYNRHGGERGAGCGADGGGDAVGAGQAVGADGGQGAGGQPDAGLGTDGREDGAGRGEGAGARVPGGMSDAYIRSRFEEHAHHVMAMAALFALRLLLGKVVESLVVLDRLLYLRENLREDCVVFGMPLFDPGLSPRTYALVAWRPVDGGTASGATRHH